MNKRIVNAQTRDMEIIDRVDNYDYEITDSHKNRPQYSSLSVESALNKLSLSEV